MEHGRSPNRRPVADHADMITELCEARCTRPRLSSHRVHNQYLTPISAKENLSYGATGGYARPGRGLAGHATPRHATARITRVHAGVCGGALDPACTRRNYATPAYPLLIYRHQVHTELGESWAGRVIRTVCHQPLVSPCVHRGESPSIHPDFNPLIKR